jgi:hypothetical protein
MADGYALATGRPSLVNIQLRQCTGKSPKC